MKTTTVKEVKHLKPRRGKQSIMKRIVGDGVKGLYQKVDTTDGSSSFVFRYTRDGVSRSMGLGSTELVPLADAREAAKEARRLLRVGKDPIVEKRLAYANNLQRVTFGDVAKDWFQAHKLDWSNAKHRTQVERSVTDLCESILDMPIADL